MKVILIAAGGTAGHIHPGIALAESLSQYEIHWVGGRKGLEHDLVPKAKLPLHAIHACPVRGKNLWMQILAFFKMSLALLQSIILILRLRANAVCVMGGYVSLPMGMAAILLRKPLWIHEQNSVPGMANRLLSRWTPHLYAGLAGQWPNVIGNPSMLVPSAKKSEKTKRVLVLGGSQGAEALNTWIADAWPLLKTSIELKHQVGSKHLKRWQNGQRDGIEVIGYLENMHEAYMWADLVIARSGAMTVSELMMYDIPAILVPLPTAVDDHQTANARIFIKHHTGWLWPQHECKPEALAKWLDDHDFTFERILKPQSKPAHILSQAIKSSLGD